ncbi:terminase small subunit [Pseudarcicella hirudinis]|uniref:terminase small subunit n=1 Tax=Pseudarcicella hirudinis TaxID=1079859 RepID=UPI0035E56396
MLLVLGGIVLKTQHQKIFLEVITRIEEIVYVQKFEGAAVGAFNANIIARDLGLADKQNIDLSTDIVVEYTGFDE